MVGETGEGQAGRPNQGNVTLSETEKADLFKIRFFYVQEAINSNITKYALSTLNIWIIKRYNYQIADYDGEVSQALCLDCQPEEHWAKCESFSQRVGFTKGWR